MAYIGKQPVVGNFVKLDAITTSATATFNLTNGGVAYFPQTANNCIVSLNGVIQSPTSAYTISGSTIVFSDALTSADSIDFILVLGDVLSIGTPSDGTITSAKLASGTDGLFAWQSVQTTGFTAVAARAYPCNTTSSAFTVTLPASPSVGDQVLLLDYAGTFATNAITLSPNGNKINGGTDNRILNTNREGVIITYIDSTQGWVASSGVNEGTVALSPPPYSVDFLVIAGGGGGDGGTGSNNAGGGGAGGYRNSYSTETSGGGGSSEASLTFNVGTVYTITVGAGGTDGGSGVSTNGVDSSISGTGLTTITSLGGGAGAAGTPSGTGGIGGSSGGSGGGAGYDGTPGGSGTANQGFAGGVGIGAGTPPYTAGGGGGASAAGVSGSTTGNGGAGLASSITGSSITRAGGGGGGSNGTAGTGGTGGGGNGGSSGGAATSATINTGSGGGGASGPGTGGSGGKGVVILRIPTANYSGTTTGSPTVTTDGSDKVIVFNDSGSITG